MKIYVTEKYCGFMYSGSRTLIYKYNANELVVIFFLKSMQVSSLHIFTLFFPISPFLPIAHQTQEEKKKKAKASPLMWWEWDQVPLKRHISENALLATRNPALRKAATIQLTEITLEGAGYARENRQAASAALCSGERWGNSGELVRSGTKICSGGEKKYG